MSKFDPESGKFRLDNGLLEDFLPVEPANSPPYELISTAEADEKSPDGFKHYPVGGDPETVAQIVAYYTAQGKTVPFGYAQAAADHAALVERTRAQ